MQICTAVLFLETGYRHMVNTVDTLFNHRKNESIAGRPAPFELLPTGSHVPCTAATAVWFDRHDRAERVVIGFNVSPQMGMAYGADVVALWAWPLPLLTVWVWDSSATNLSFHHRISYSSTCNCIVSARRGGIGALDLALLSG